MAGRAGFVEVLGLSMVLSVGQSPRALQKVGPNHLNEGRSSFKASSLLAAFPWPFISFSTWTAMPTTHPAPPWDLTGAKGASGDPGDIPTEVCREPPLHSCLPPSPRGDVWLGWDFPASWGHSQSRGSHFVPGPTFQESHFLAFPVGPRGSMGQEPPWPARREAPVRMKRQRRGGVWPGAGMTGSPLLWSFGQDPSLWEEPRFR